LDHPVSINVLSINIVICPSRVRPANNCAAGPVADNWRGIKICVVTNKYPIWSPYRITVLVNTLYTDSHVKIRILIDPGYNNTVVIICDQNGVFLSVQIIANGYPVRFPFYSSWWIDFLSINITIGICSWISPCYKCFTLWIYCCSCIKLASGSSAYINTFSSPFYFTGIVSELLTWFLIIRCL
jgi:hypothetical protein